MVQEVGNRVGVGVESGKNPVHRGKLSLYLIGHFWFRMYHLSFNCCGFSSDCLVVLPVKFEAQDSTTHVFLSRKMLVKV